MRNPIYFLNCNRIEYDINAMKLEIKQYYNNGLSEVEANEIIKKLLMNPKSNSSQLNDIVNKHKMNQNQSIILPLNDAELDYIVKQFQFIFDENDTPLQYG